MLDISFEHPVLFPPGSAFDYSNTNTVLLGLVVEAVSGHSLGSFIEENTLTPAGLTRTVFPVAAEIVAACPWLRYPARRQCGRCHRLESVVELVAGNMISTLEDMRVWSRIFANGQLIRPR